MREVSDEDTHRVDSHLLPFFLRKLCRWCEHYFVLLFSYWFTVVIISYFISKAYKSPRCIIHVVEECISYLLTSLHG